MKSTENDKIVFPDSYQKRIVALLILLTLVTLLLVLQFFKVVYFFSPGSSKEQLEDENF